MDLNFAAICPECEHVQTHTYQRADLVRKIQLGASIDFFCTRCDQRRVISWDERWRLLRVLTDPQRLPESTRS